MNKRTVKCPIAKKKANPMEMPVVSFAETEEWSAWLAVFVAPRRVGRNRHFRKE
jgi:hypothetical protein